MRRYSRYSSLRTQPRTELPVRRALVVAANRSQIERWRAQERLPREEVVPVCSYAEARSEGAKYVSYRHAFVVELPGARELDEAERQRIIYHLFGLGISAERVVEDVQVVDGLPGRE